MTEERSVTTARQGYLLEIVSRFRSRLIEDLLGKGARPLEDYLDAVPREHWALSIPSQGKSCAQTLPWLGIAAGHVAFDLNCA